MLDTGYLMESEQEAIRLDLKTDPDVVKKQALWAGIKPGMRIADLGCGSGKTSYHLNKLAKPNSESVNSQTISEKFADKLRNLKFAIGRT